MSRYPKMSKTDLAALPVITAAVKRWETYRDTPQEFADHALPGSTVRERLAPGQTELRLPVTGPSDCALFVASDLAAAGLTIVRKRTPKEAQ